MNKKTFHMPRPEPPIQQPRIPIWVVGAWGSRKSMQRAIRYDGILPNILEAGKVRMSPAQPDEIAEIYQYIVNNRQIRGPFDIVVEGETPGGQPDRAKEIVAAYRDAGATWWIEAMWGIDNHDLVLERIKQGPPRV